MVLFGVLGVLLTTILLPSNGAKAQSIQWSAGATASIHNHVYDAPLDIWDNAGLVFPSIGIHGEYLMTFVGGPLGRRLYLRSGIRYTRLASQVDWVNNVTGNQTQVFSGQFSIRQHYAVIPLHFRVAVGNTPLSVHFGPSFGILLFATKKSDTFTPVEFSTSQHEAVGEDVNRINVMLSGGLSVQLTRQIRALLQYNAGMSNAKKSADRTVLVTDWQTQEFEIGLEFAFPGRKDP